MADKASKVGHVPARTCLCCRVKLAPTQLKRFVIIDGQPVFDGLAKQPGRGYYLCHQDTCQLKLEKWLKKRRKNANKK